MGTLLAFTTALSYSVAAITIRSALRPSVPDNGVFIGVATNLLLLTVLSLFAGLHREVRAENLQALALFGVSGVMTTWLGRASLYSGIRRLGAGPATAIKNMNPLVAGAIGLVFLGERLGLLGYTGAALALLGYFLLMRDRLGSAPAPGSVPSAGRFRGLEASDSSERNVVLVGYLAASGAALAFGGGQAVRRLGLEELPNPYVGAWAAAFGGFAVYCLILLGTGRFRSVVRVNILEGGGRFLAAGVLTTVGQLAFFLALMSIPLTHASIVAASDTIITMALAALLLGGEDRLTRLLVLAGGAVFGGSVLLALSG